ncbi:flagellar basal body M-ring protein FliF [Bacillus lacus]|uniref:Flagellar M-ring protein n=1 Tax=Metabacillus lacus TaxID=1983721 RepID=A0A7X2IVJ5_9BACI|nr:flagellar basal-body MS-ring/collar protein FliF [Metabacillus lacus]MRX70591.1 flagellar basal body M-ring protein FliF [Metabacillus lacus]
MNQKLIELKNKTSHFWSERPPVQKGLIGGGVLLLFILIAGISIAVSNTKFVPLYKNLSVQETGQIKETLDSKGIKSEITDNGTTIRVPEELTDSLKVELAAQGIPDSGNIDYSFFGQNVGFGMTDNEFDVLKLKATQTELANLIKGIDGVQDAKVMINLPKQSVFVGDAGELSSASIVIHMKPGNQLDQSKVNGLYHLAAKSIPNLPTDNIVIMDQNFQYFDLKNNIPLVADFSNQYEIKKQIERDIQREVQKMLGTMMGQDKVVVSVSTDIDFTQENREENLVEPVDEENMEGIAISAERVTETFSGSGGRAAGGVPGANETDIPGYTQAETGDGGDYERIEERINNEVNRVKKEIVESPYKIRDIGIQVMVEPPNNENGQAFPQQRIDDIQQILSTIVKTSIYKESGAEPVGDQEIADKIVVSVQPFDGKQALEGEAGSSIPGWIFAVGGALFIIIIILITLLVRNRRSEDEYEIEEEFEERKLVSVPDVNDETENEGTARKKQLEKLAREKPEEFAKLLRSWITEDQG